MCVWWEGVGSRAFSFVFKHIDHTSLAGLVCLNTCKNICRVCVCVCVCVCMCVCLSTSVQNICTCVRVFTPFSHAHTGSTGSAAILRERIFVIRLHVLYTVPLCYHRKRWYGIQSHQKHHQESKSTPVYWRNSVKSVSG